MSWSAASRFTKLAIASLMIALVAAPSATSAEPSREQATVKAEIAVVGPMSGQNAPFGEQMRRGAEMAVRDLNARGGVLGQPISLVVMDDNADAKLAVSVAESLARQGVRLVVGHLNSGASIPASAVYAKYGILQITPYSPNPALTEDAFRRGWRNVLRIYTRDDAHAIAVARYLAESYRAEKIAILHDGTAFGQSVGREALKNLRLAGLQETLFLMYAPQQRDYSGLVSHLRSRGISVIYITGWYGSDVALMIRQAHEMGYRPRVISTDAITTPRFWNITGRAGEGTLLTFVPDQRKNSAARNIVQRFHRENFEPSGYTLYTYAAIQAWAQAAHWSKSFKTNELVHALRAASFDTVIGTIRFDEKGDVIPQLVTWYVWHNGRYVPATDKDLSPHRKSFPEQQSSRVPPLCRDVGGYEAYMRRTGEACRLY